MLTKLTIYDVKLIFWYNCQFWQNRQFFWLKWQVFTQLKNLTKNDWNNSRKKYLWMVLRCKKLSKQLVLAVFSAYYGMRTKNLFLVLSWAIRCRLLNTGLMHTGIPELGKNGIFEIQQNQRDRHLRFLN